MEKNKSTISDLYQKCFNERNLDLLPNYIDDDFVGLKGVKGAPGFRATLEPIINAVPDIHYVITSVVAADDKVAVSWTWTGTFAKGYLHFEPTNKTFTNDGIAIYTFRDGKVTATTSITDRLGFLIHVGAINPEILTGPAPSTAAGGADSLFFVDKFFVPAAAIDEFNNRMKINRDMLRSLPGFVKDNAYGYKDADGNLICMTIAVWKDHASVDNARQFVQAEYKKEGFDMPGMLARLHITIDRGLYKPMN